MNRNEAHALANIVQAAIGYIELGRSAMAVKTLLDVQLLTGVQAISWSGSSRRFVLDRGYQLNIEGLPDQAIYVEVHHTVEDREIETPRAFALPCSTALEVAEQIIAYCHVSAARSTTMLRLLPSKDSQGSA